MGPTWSVGLHESLREQLHLTRVLFALHELLRMSPISNAGCCLAVDCCLAELHVRSPMFVVYVIQLRVGAIVLVAVVRIRGFALDV